MSMGFGQGQGMALGAWTPLANLPSQGFPNPAGNGLVTLVTGYFFTTLSGVYIVTL